MTTCNLMSQTLQCSLPGGQHGYIIDHIRRDIFVFSIVRASICHVPFGLIEETEETIIMTFIDDTNGLVFALTHHKLTDPAACLFHKFVVHAGISEDMVAR